MEANKNVCGRCWRHGNE